MPRIPYLPQDLAEPAELVAAIRTRRGGQLLNLDRMLLHSPPFAQGWNAFLGAVRGALTLPVQLRELAICGVAVLNGAEYEFLHHAPEYRQAGGTPAQVEALREFTAVPEHALFSAAERAVARITIEMTRTIRVSETTWTSVAAELPERQLVELVGVIASYNMVSRFLVALGVEPE